MPLWKLKSGKYHRKGEVLRPGAIIEASEYAMRGFLDVMERIDPDIPVMDKPKAVPPIVRGSASGLGYFDVLNPDTGEPLNDRPLVKSEAEALAGAPVPEEEETVDLDLTKKPDVEEESNDGDMESSEDVAGPGSVHLGGRPDTEGD